MCVKLHMCSINSLAQVTGLRWSCLVGGNFGRVWETLRGLIFNVWGLSPPKPPCSRPCLQCCVHHLAIAQCSQSMQSVHTTWRHSERAEWLTVIIRNSVCTFNHRIRLFNMSQTCTHKDVSQSTLRDEKLRLTLYQQVITCVTHLDTHRCKYSTINSIHC